MVELKIPERALVPLNMSLALRGEEMQREPIYRMPSLLERSTRYGSIGIQDNHSGSIMYEESKDMTKYFLGSDSYRTGANSDSPDRYFGRHWKN